MSATPFSGRVALVSGASRGIGYHTARLLAEQGAEVIALARSDDGLKKLAAEVGASDAPGRVVTVALDLMDRDAIAALGERIGRDHGRLDVLIANAAERGPTGPIASLDPAGFERCVALNFTAIWYLIRAFDGLLRASDAGRAVMVTSGSAHFAQPMWGPYPATKAALETLSRVWANEVADTALRVNIFDPGPVATEIRNDAHTNPNVKLAQPEDVAVRLVEAALPTAGRNGQIYTFKDQTWKRHQLPAVAS